MKINEISVFRLYYLYTTLLLPPFQYCNEVMHSLNEQVVTRIREIDLTCYTLILPVWQEIATKSLPEGTLVSLLATNNVTSLC